MIQDMGLLETETGERVVNTQDLKQPFGIAYNEKPPIEASTYTTEYFDPWLESLTGNHVLELAAGQGIEAKHATEKGFKVVCLDLSREMAAKTHFDKNQYTQADVAHLPFPENSLDGVYGNDFLIFVSPEKKRLMLNEIFRVLKPGGKVLLQSQIGDKLRIRYYIVKGRNPDGTPQYAQANPHETYENNDSWQEKVREIENKGDEISVIEFHLTPEMFEQDAAQAKFINLHTTQYGYNDPLSKEDRWYDYSGFITSMEKPLKSKD